MECVRCILRFRQITVARKGWLVNEKALFFMAKNFGKHVRGMKYHYDDMQSKAMEAYHNRPYKFHKFGAGIAYQFEQTPGNNVMRTRDDVDSIKQLTTLFASANHSAVREQLNTMAKEYRIDIPGIPIDLQGAKRIVFMFQQVIGFLNKETDSVPGLSAATMEAVYNARQPTYVSLEDIREAMICGAPGSISFADLDDEKYDKIAIFLLTEFMIYAEADVYKADMCEYGAAWAKAVIVQRTAAAIFVDDRGIQFSFVLLQ